MCRLSKESIPEIINFGDELLLGIRENTHLTYLSGELARYGLPVRRNRVIADEASEIQYAVSEAWKRSNIVITTGGLGPTSDDRTRENIAKALGIELVFDSEIEAWIRTRVDRPDLLTEESHRKQCYRFSGNRALRNHHGTAPGLILERDNKRLIMLPGPTHELKPMFEKQVIPILRDWGVLGEKQMYLQIRTCGSAESVVQKKVEPLMRRYPDLAIAYCLHYGIVDLRLSLQNRKSGMDSLKLIGRDARKLLGEDFVCWGDVSIEELLFRELLARNRTLAVAESCTGGLLCHALTELPGVSKVFAGGVVCYSNEIKISQVGVAESIIKEHGAVSPECAMAMASGISKAFSADCGLSLTGFAGPGGGNEKNPCGTVHMGYRSPAGVFCKTVCYEGSRSVIKARAAQTALDWVRRRLLKHKS